MLSAFLIFFDLPAFGGQARHPFSKLLREHFGSAKPPLGGWRRISLPLEKDSRECYD